MRTTWRVLIGPAIALLLPAGVLAQKVGYDYNRHADFRDLKTYSFRESSADERMS